MHFDDAILPCDGVVILLRGAIGVPYVDGRAVARPGDMKSIVNCRAGRHLQLDSEDVAIVDHRRVHDLIFEHGSQGAGRLRHLGPAVDPPDKEHLTCVVGAIANLLCHERLGQCRSHIMRQKQRGLHHTST